MDLETVVQVGLFIGLLILGLSAGSMIENQHFASLHNREQQSRHLSTVNFGCKHPLPDTVEAQMFIGSVVISSDYFKSTIGSLISLFGGRLTVFETLLERGRREAVLRMKEQAIAWGATQILNVRLETSELNKDGRNPITAIEVIAYGTGIR
ncbi:MAG: YbjQ family protein [Kaiparowitsia implicata GSE-PSE-MK54-09C]|jgi:uncharacterized protein YbjQ (UPF0145 family)|nr:YbjQ family protein [Kaiparowitsia implicata GSE-PSE-MK54-09C]